MCFIVIFFFQLKLRAKRHCVVNYASQKIDVGNTHFYRITNTATILSLTKCKILEEKHIVSNFFFTSVTFFIEKYATFASLIKTGR